MRKRINLDYAAGKNNPNAIYLEGRIAREKLESARARIAKVIIAATDEIVLTGAETDLFTMSFLGKNSHAITTLFEHSSVLREFRKLENTGVEVTYLQPSPEGYVTAKQVEEALRANTKLVSVMYANNEIGTIQPIKEISRMLRRRGLPRIHFHSDCVQAPGLLPINVQSLGVDMASFSAPKFGGPSGASFVYTRRSTKVSESLVRVRDTAPVELASEMADALEKAERNREEEVSRLTKLRDYFIDKLIRLPGIRINLNGSQENRLANNVNVLTPLESELLVIELDNAGVCASAGAACESGECKEGSHVILALGKSIDEAKRAIRFSLGSETSKSDLDYVIKLLPKIINKHTNIWQTK